MATATLPRPKSSPSIVNDLAARDAHATVDHSASAASVFVTAEQWHARSADGHDTVRELTSELVRLERHTAEVKTALVLVVAREYAADPSKWAFKSGKANLSPLIESLGITQGRLASTVRRGVLALIEADAPLYGPLTPELMALALSYAETARRQDAKARAEAKAAKGDTEGAATESADAPAKKERKLSPAEAFMAGIEQAVTALDALDADDPDVFQLMEAVDMLSDRVATRLGL